MTNPAIFRAYDVRGIYGTELTPALALDIGAAFSTFLGGDAKIVVGRDVRLSSPTLRNALVAGITSTGSDVVDIGMAPTPLVYFWVARQDLDGGVAITASHNPPEYNGFKFCRERAICLSWESGISRIAEIVRSKKFIQSEWKRIGGEEERDAISQYIAHVRKLIKTDRKLKVVVDSGNGTCGWSSELFSQLGCEVVPLYAEPDGRFPNHIPDPAKDETLAELTRAVVREKANLGFAFDGDGDRVGFVDERGEILRGDDALIIFARDLLRERAGAKILFDVTCSKAVEDEIRRSGGLPITTRVGHSYVQERLIEEEAPFAGEYSGHYYFASEHLPIDDAIFAACKMVEIVSRDGALSKLAADVPRYHSTPQIRVPCPDEEKAKAVMFLQGRFKEQGYELDEIDGVRVRFERGWALIRPSNTEPALVLRFEAENPTDLERIRDLIWRELRSLESVKP